MPGQRSGTIQPPGVCWNPVPRSCRMHIVYKADNLFDAHLVKHALEDAGIPAFVFGEPPLFGVLRVGIPDAARPQAEEIVAALDLGHAADAPISDADDIAGLPA